MYKELKEKLPKENPLQELYKKAKDKNKFNKELFFVYEGNIEMEVLSLHNLYWEGRTKFDTEKANAMPIVLGNIVCKIITGSEGLLYGNVHTNNMMVSYPRYPNTFISLLGNLEVDGLLFSSGKGLWGRKFNFNIIGKAKINTWVNNEQSEIVCNDLIIKHKFIFPQVYITKDRSKHALKKTDWSRYSLDELTKHFNTKLLVLKEYGNHVDFFFDVHRKLAKKDCNYIKKK